MDKPSSLGRLIGAVFVLLMIAACTHQAGVAADGSRSPAESPSTITPSTSPSALPISPPSHAASPGRAERSLQANKVSGDPAVSADGRWVAFSSHATNLVAGDTNRASDVFVHDRETKRTVRVSVSSRGRQANSDSFGPSISADGRMVSFISWSTDLVSERTNHCLAVAAEYPGCGNAYVHDMKTGVTSRVSVSRPGRQGTERTETASISENGRFVVFRSWSKLVLGDTNECSEGGGLDEPAGCPDIFVRDLVAHTTERISVDPNGAQFKDRSGLASISDDGSTVLFQVSEGFGLHAALYVRNRAAASTVRVPYAENVSTREGQRVGVLTGDGNQVIYTIDVGAPQGCRVDFAPPGEQICASYTYEMYAYHLATGTTERITPAKPTGESLVWDGFSVSTDGRYVTFSSDRSNLVPGDRNGSIDVFLFDRAKHSLVIVSRSSRGSQGNRDSYDGQITPDGSVVVFASQASNLVTGDTNRASDIFLKGLITGTTTRVSIRSTY